ncbi:MAG: ABC transporter substrate-binding protein [Chloroflexi bacterium]|nr:ABC transporter substrate-binding protein [Chloroflexota bacterium]
MPISNLTSTTEHASTRLTRRQFIRLGATASMAAVVLAACGPSGASPTTAPAPAGTTAPGAVKPPAIKKGSIFKVAILGEPPNIMDSMFTTATITNNISQQFFEGLFTQDMTYAAKPLLVEDYKITESAKVFEFKLRKGVKFHNGKVFDSGDVTASLNRWFQIVGRGQTVFKQFDKFETPDASTVRMIFKAPTGILLDFLSRAEAFMLPADIANAAGKNALKPDQLIGTGVFKLAEYVTDRYIRGVRYPDYAPKESKESGPADRREAFFDEIQFIPTPDAAVRLNGLINGDFQYADTLDGDQYDQLKSASQALPIIVKPYYWYCPHFNKKKGMFTSEKLRQAVAAAINCEEAMAAGFGNKDFWRLDPGINAPETAWYSKAGAENYNKVDLSKVKSLLQDAGYKGEPIRWLATKEYAYNYKFAEYIKQKLEAAGMKVELQVSDWATLVKNRANPDIYDVFLTGHSSYTHPATHPFMAASWPGWWDDPERDRILNGIVAESDIAKQKPLFEEMQALVWKQMPFVKLGDNFLLRGIRKEIGGYVNFPDWFFFNAGVTA